MEDYQKDNISVVGDHIKIILLVNIGICIGGTCTGFLSILDSRLGESNS